MDLPDPRSSGSNNPGATNVLRLGGKKKGKLAAGLTLFGDILKGFIPVFLAQLITDKSTTIALVGLGAFVGHLYPVFFWLQRWQGCCDCRRRVFCNQQLCVIDVAGDLAGCRICL